MVKGLTRHEIAKLVANDIPDGFYVNLGIGMPTLISRYLPSDRDVILHTENGIVGMGPGDYEAGLDLDLINASKEPVSLLPGSSITDHVVSFAMMRGGHLDLTVLGAFQVSETGDIANWDTGAKGTIPAVGGAMDLVAGAKQLFVTMEHVARDGRPKIVSQCSYPLTGKGVVNRIYTDLAIIEVQEEGLLAVAMLEGMDFPQLQSLTGCPLRLAPDFRVLKQTRKAS